MPTDAEPEPADKLDAKPQAKRRWYQFSLRTLLIGTAALAAGLRWVAPARQQRAILPKVIRRAICGLSERSPPRRFGKHGNRREP